MAKGKQEIKQPPADDAAPAAPFVAPSGARSVPAASFDPADESNNFNTDRPVPVMVKPRTFEAHYGHADIHEGAGESRPMFAQSAKE